MNLALWKKTIVEARLLFACCAAGLFAFCWLRVWIVGQLEIGKFANIIQSMPPWFKALLPVPVEFFVSFPGRIAFTFEDLILYLILLLWCIARGSDAVSGEIGRGTMEILLSQPVSRLQILFSQGCVTVLGMALLALAVQLGITCGIYTTTAKVEEEPPALVVPFFQWRIPLPWADANDRPAARQVPMRELVEPRIFLPGALNYFSLGAAFAGLATFVGSWDRFRWRTIGIVAAIFLLQLMTKLVAVTAPGWKWLGSFTVLGAYDPCVFIMQANFDWPSAWRVFGVDGVGEIAGFGPMGYNLILLGLGAVCYAAAAVVFCRRDLPAPL